MLGAESRHVVRAEDMPLLREVCRHFLYATRWAGWLGEPLPRSHRGTSRKSRDVVTQIRHERAVCAFITGEAHDASQPSVSGAMARVAALRVYVEECQEAARFARQEGRYIDEDWWAGEELAARGALLEAECA